MSTYPTPSPALDPERLRRLLGLYPALASLHAQDPTGFAAVLSLHTQLHEVPSGTVLFDEGAPCGGFPLVLRGCIRVARGSPGGRSLELYRVLPGEICVVSTACLVSPDSAVPLAAHGQAAEASELLTLDNTGFERWLSDPGFRRAVMAVFAQRLADLMALVEAVAFQRLDQRLASVLLAHGSTLHITHQALADELGTVREIVTRLLRRFEREGWLALGRERIDLVDPQALRVLAEAGHSPEPVRTL